jgi:glycolate oxidase iron-sulfur subunit
MQTRFSPEQLADPATATSEAAIRKCVHCGFCTSTCPTYVLLGDELDSPRGRISLIQDMLENDRTPTTGVVEHIDRCLSCLSCMTTCPSGVDYRRLIDHARTHVERRYRRPLAQRLMRAGLAAILPFPRRFRLALALARIAKPAAALLHGSRVANSICAMLRLAPPIAASVPTDENSPATSARKGRVALLRGCVESTLQPHVRYAAVRVLNRAGYDVVFAADEGCCGALVHHLGQEQAALDAARRNIDAWTHQIENEGLDAIVVTASGCGSVIKDYGFMFRGDSAYAQKAARVSGLARDISEILAESPMPAGGSAPALKVAYHAACSLQHGQGAGNLARGLLEAAGFVVAEPAEKHLCCGSAGVYNILEPEIAGRLGERKAAALGRVQADVIATGNIGCSVQIAAFGATPVTHVVELLDWAGGGPRPPALQSIIAEEKQS